MSALPEQRDLLVRLAGTPRTAEQLGVPESALLALQARGWVAQSMRGNWYLAPAGYDQLGTVPR